MRSSSQIDRLRRSWPDRNIPPHARKNLWRTQGTEGAGDREWHSGAKWTRIYHSIASRLTSSEKFIMKINQLFCIQLIYGTWSRFRPRANFAICSICSAISLATFTMELFSSSHLSVSSCSSWAANYKTSNKTSTIRAPQEIIMISLRAPKWMKEKRWCTSSRSSYNKFSQNFIVQNC